MADWIVAQSKKKNRTWREEKGKYPPKDFSKQPQWRKAGLDNELF